MSESKEKISKIYTQEIKWPNGTVTDEIFFKDDRELAFKINEIIDKITSGSKALIGNAEEIWRRRGLMSFNQFYEEVKVLGVTEKQAKERYLIAIEQYKRFIISEFN